jgi:hypothetical protein
MRSLLLLAVAVAGCSASVAAPVPVAATKSAASDAAPAPKPSIVYGTPLGAVPSGWRVTISGGPTYIMAGPPQVIRIPHPTRTPPFSLEYFWASPPAPVAFSVYVDENSRMRLTGNEFGISNNWMVAGPMAPWSDVQCAGSWAGHTLTLDPL